MARYIFVTGGVVSSLGKGLTSAAVGLLLERRGLKIGIQKLDPYINVDPGTMSPYQHGEVYVTNDGAEADLDLGHYERFTSMVATRNSNWTTGKIYLSVIQKERRGDYLGDTVQVIPHITNEIKDAIRSAGRDVDIVLDALKVVVEFDGNLGLVIGAGGGSLTLFDAVRKHGGRPANYCEIGGNPSVSKVCNLTRLILSKPGVDKIAVMMNVVSNTRVDIVARGVIKGCVESGVEPKDVIAIFRIPGSWEDEGFKILEKYQIEYCDRSVSMFEAAGRAVAKLQA